MSDYVVDALTYFHFLRPGWLSLVPIVMLLWWRVRARRNRRPDPPSGLAPHLAAALSVGRQRHFRILAIDTVAITLVLTSLAVAGPTWSRVPSPFATQTAPLAVALSTATSMLAADVAPDRLERAKQKLLDLLDTRAGARTALIAYAGTAHRVVPLSEDPSVVKPFIEGLSPDIMPVEGANATAALELASFALEDEVVPGAILFILDEFDGADMPAFERHAEKGGASIVFLTIGSSDTTLALLDRVPGSSVVSLTPDASDVRRVERRVAAAYRDALANDDRQQWEDRGWMLAWPAALLTLVYFRRGWTISIGLFVSLGFALTAPAPANADHFATQTVDRVAAWFLTADQRGRLAFEAERYEEAAETFEDPMWKGYALYFLGHYDEAAATYARLTTADAAVGEGLALVKARKYRPGINAFEKALERDPNHVQAAHDVEIARAILGYLEALREATGTEEGSEGADEIVFDKESQSGKATAMGARDQMKIESAEQWMRTVETRAADFLSIRFALEAAKEGR
jgi:Ca-activated chloride channel family protein